MSKHELHLLAAAYSSKSHAETIQNTLKTMHSATTITLKDSEIIASDTHSSRLGGLIGKVWDPGIKNEQLDELAARLKPGQAAVVALVPDDSVIATQEALEGYDGEMLVFGVDDEVLKKALEMEASNQTVTDDPPRFR